MTASEHFTAQRQGDDIYETSYYNSPKKVGVSLAVFEKLTKEYNQLVPLFNEYQEKLIALGAIKLPKTTEELMQEQAEENKQIRAQLAQVTEQLAALTGALNGRNEHTDKSVNGETKNAGTLVGGLQNSVGNAEKSTSSSQVSK